MAYLAEQIGGGHVHVTSLTQPGQEPHDLEISTRQTARLEESDAVLYLKGLQPAVDDAVAQSGVKTKIDAASLTTLEQHGNEVGGHATEHDHEHGEESGGLDPHIWLDPVRYAEVARGVGAAFAKADPAHAADYTKNTDALVKKLDALNTEFADGLKNTRTKVFLTTHAAFGYLAERYGLTEEAINGLDPESEPSAARVKELQAMAKADGVSTVFYETLVSDKTAKTVARDAGLRTDVLDPIEGITKKSRGQDYLQVMRANLTALRTALGAR
jgi:zinc transport system substrate-binding protein